MIPRAGGSHACARTGNGSEAFILKTNGHRQREMVVVRSSDALLSALVDQSAFTVASGRGSILCFTRKQEFRNFFPQTRGSTTRSSEQQKLRVWVWNVLGVMF